MKDKLNTLPQIDATFEQDNSPEYANVVLDKLLTHYTLNEISAHSGISRRNISYMRHRGINTFPMQVTLEILAGFKTVEETPLAP